MLFLRPNFFTQQRPKFPAFLAGKCWQELATLNESQFHKHCPEGCYQLYWTTWWSCPRIDDWDRSSEFRLCRVHSHAPSIQSHRGSKVVWPDFQPMRVPEEPVCIDLFRQNPVFTSLHLKSPVHVHRLRIVPRQSMSGLHPLPPTTFFFSWGCLLTSRKFLKISNWPSTRFIWEVRSRPLILLSRDFPIHSWDLLQRLVEDFFYCNWVDRRSQCDIGFPPAKLKGSLTRVFLLQVFFMNQILPEGPWVSYSRVVPHFHI